MRRELTVSELIAQLEKISPSLKVRRLDNGFNEIVQSVDIIEDLERDTVYVRIS
jgi:hypothetical protein